MPNDADNRPGLSFPTSGMAPSERNVVVERLRAVKRSAVDAAMGRGESWTTKVLNLESGVLVSDMPRFLAALGLKAVPIEHIHVDPAVAQAYETLVAKAVQSTSLLLGKAE
jgi:hypothetical protein